MIQRLTRFLFVFTVLALLCCGAVTHAAVLINEVATAESGGADWVELYNTGPGTQSIENWELFERSSSVKTFPAYTMAVNEYIVVHFNATSADETGSDTNGNGYREFYSADSGLTGTDNVVSIKDNAAAFQDAISYANGDGSWAGAQQTAFDDIVNGGQWTGTAGAGIPTNDTESVSSSGLGAGESLTRSSDSADTNAKADWTLIGAQSPGGATPTALTATIVINEVVFSGDDWTELYCVNDDNGGSGVNLRGCVITDLDSTGLTHQKVLGDSDNDGTADQDCTLKSGEYLLLYYVSDPPPAADETESGADDVVTLYTDAQTGLTGTEEQQVLVDALGNYVDAVCWSNMDGSFTAGEKSSVEDLAGAATPAWVIATPGDAAQSDCVNSNGIPSNYSIGRDASSTDTANSKDEWYWFDTDAASPGAVNPAPAVLTDFTVTAPSYAVSGQTIEVTITARDQNQSTLLSYAGTVDLTSTNGSVTIAPGSSSGFDDGVLSVDVTLTGAGEQTTVQAADSENAGITGTSGTINVVTELPQPVFVINEVVFDGGGGGIDHDWVEIYCKDDGLSGAGINISGYTVRATSEGTIDKTVGDCTVKTGEYIILHYASDGSATDDTTATDGVINIYTTVSGLTGTDDVVVLYNSSSEVLDVVAWVDGDLPAGMITYLTDLNSGGHWGGATPADCFDSTVIGSGDSIARDANSTDTASKDDWTKYANPTPGAPSATAVTAPLRITEVVFDGSPDWIEIYYVDDGSDPQDEINLKGCVITDMDSSSTSHQKILGDSNNDGSVDQDCTLKEGEFLILYYEEGTDETSAAGGNDDNVVEVYTSEQTGITGTNEQQALLDGLGNYLDAVCWAEHPENGGDNTLPSTEETNVTELTNNTQWVLAGGSPVRTDCVDSKPVGSGQSIARRSDKIETEDNGLTDWLVLKNPNPGALTPSAVTARLMINEVLVKNKTGEPDWIEIHYAASSGDTVNLKGAYITDLDSSSPTHMKVFGDDDDDGNPEQDCNLAPGEFIVLIMGVTTEADETESGGDGVVSLAAGEWSSITSTDETLALYDAVGNLLDCVAFSDGALPSAELEDVQTLLDAADAYTPANKAWTDFDPTDADPNDCFLSTTMKTGWSMARDSVPTDNNSKDDWTPRSTPTQGANNGDPATVHHFDVDAPAYAVSGTAFSVTLTARNEDNTVMDTYTGTAVLTSTQGAVAITPGSASGFVDGVLTLDVTLTGSTGQTTTIHAEDSGNTGESAQIQIVDTIPSPVLVINEVAFDGGGGGFENDWIEILCLDDGLGGSGFNLAGYTFRPKNATTIDKTIGDCTIKTGEFLLLQYNTEGQTDETQLSGDWIDIYTEDSGLTSSDELVALYTPAEQVVDMVVWANQNGSFSNLSEEYLTTLVTDGHWVKAGDTVAESDCVNSEVVGGKDSIARTLNETTGQPNDTHAVGDWIVTTVPTPGKSNDSGPQPNVGLRITELAPDGGGGGYASDWIEVYCYDDLSSGGGVDISGYSFYIDSKVKTITNGTTVRTGEYILLVFDTEDNDETEASDGLIKIFSDKSGMVTSDDQVVIYDHKDNLIDAVCYTNMDGEPLTQTETDDMTEIIGANGWVGTVDEASCASIAELEEEQSLGRDRSFTDTDTAADWSVFASPTPGKVNALAGEPYALEITPTSRVSTFVGVAVELTVRVVDVFGDVVTSSSLQIDLNTDSSSAEISSDDGFTWSSSDTGYSSGGTLGALFRDSNVGRFTVSATTPGGAVSPAIKEITVLDLPPVVLNELMYNPAEDSGLEYVELYNRSGASVDLTGWKLAVGDSSIEIPDDTTIASGEHLVLCKELDTFESVYGDATGTWGDYPSENFQAVDTASFSMSNTTDTVGLVSVDNVTKTYVTYLDSWGADGNGMSLEKKDPDALDTNDPDVDVYNWGESDQFFGQGTPGQRNSNYEGAPSTLEMVHVSPGIVFIGEPLVISVKVISNNDIETVRLYYRTAGSGASYTMLTMNRLAGTHLFQVRIPQEDVSLSGIEYYLQATDVDHSVTLPADNPTTSPYTITVEDNTVKVMVVPRKKGVSEGEYFYVDIMIVNARDLVEASFEITYDTTYLDIQDMDKNRDGDQVAVGSLMEAGFNEINLADKGLISFKVTGLDDEVNGDGPLAVIYYKIKNPNEGVPLPSGTYPLHLQNCLVIDKDENEAVPAMFDGDVIIGTGSSELVDTRGGVVSGPWGTQLQVPSGAMKGTFRITIEQMEAGDIPTVDNLNANQYLVPTMIALDIQPHTLVFTRPVTLVFGFDDDAIEALGIDEDNLAIYHWHQDLSAGKALLPKRKNRTRLRPRRGQRSVRFFGSPGSGRTSTLQGAGDTYWERIGGEVAKGDNTVTAMVDRPGVYMLVGDTDPGGQMSIYDVKVSPNPFRPTDGSLKPETYLTFRMSNNAEELWVRIYDVKGRLVKTLADDVSDVSRGLVQYTWNGTDDAGSTVSTGIYVMSIYAEDEFVRLAKAETTVIVSKNMYE